MTGLMLGCGLVFHIVENERPYDLTGSGQIPSFWDVFFTAGPRLPRLKNAMVSRPSGTKI